MTLTVNYPDSSFHGVEILALNRERHGPFGGLWNVLLTTGHRVPLFGSEIEVRP